jgi:CheY-like chemotaxis protein
MLKRLGINRKEESVDGEPVQTDVQQILAYLEELARLRTLVHLHLRSEPPLCLGARVELVNDQDLTFSLSFPHQVPRLEPGEVLDLHFPLAGMRFRSAITYRERGAYMQSVFKLPRTVQFADRRMAMRTRIGSREKASAALFESLFEGVATSGPLLNVSMEGLCMQIERAIHIQANRRLAPHAELFHEGQKLHIVRIMNLPRLPTIECAGEVRFARAGQGGPILLGIRLEGLGREEQGYLHQYMSRRLPTFARAFPVRRRRGALDEPAPEEIPPEERHDEEVADDGEDATEVVEDPVFAALEQDGASVQDRLIRLRRRGKRILVIIPDDLDRSIFICTLEVGGYANFMEAKNLVQGLELSKKAQVDAIFLDQKIGPLTGTEVAQRLRKMGRMHEVPIFQFMHAPEVRALLSAKAAGVNHVIKLPVDFDGELKLLLDRTFGLIKQ